MVERFEERADREEGDEPSGHQHDGNEDDEGKPEGFGGSPHAAQWIRMRPPKPSSYE